MIHTPRVSPRGEYLQQENTRVQASPALATKFPRLKSMTVDLESYDSEGRSRSSYIKYTVNVTHAKSVFRVMCQNPECVRGDFDLSDALAQAVLKGEKNVVGEMRCEGWRGRATIDIERCRNILRYKVSLSY